MRVGWLGGGLVRRGDVGKRKEGMKLERIKHDPSYCSLILLNILCHCSPLKSIEV